VIGCDLVSVVGKLVHGRKKLSFPVPLAGVRQRVNDGMRGGRE
jgi:hypothetical protein